jgi:hypothetical protein
MALDLVLPPNAEVISAVGDALSLIRAERERTFATEDPGALAALVAEVEDEAVRAGAGASSLDVRVEHLAERGAVRVTATGSVALLSGAVPGRPPADVTEATAVALDHGYPQARRVGQFWVCQGGPHADRMAVLDQFADLVLDVRGELLPAAAVHAPEPGAGVADVFTRGIKRMGPVTLTPDVWLISGSRLLQVPVSDPAQVAPTVLALCPPGADFTLIVGRE